MSEVTIGNEVTFQFQCSSESTNGTSVQGGQIPELIFYGPTSSCTDGSQSNTSTLRRKKATDEKEQTQPMNWNNAMVKVT